MSRIVEIMLVTLLILLSLPLWILISLLILIFSPGSVIFVHPRVGHYGRLFGLVKFRTMRSRTGGANLTVGDDNRITGVGRILRRFKLDEMPQFWNILLGQMTFVGPRPEAEEYVNSYTAAQREILNYKPGLTDPASLKYRHEAELLGRQDDPQAAYRDVVLPEKIKLSLEYQRRRTVRSDIGIVLKTLRAVLSARPPVTGQIKL
jgi:lipopolysaccharide/colanic/teichoic acid biosynthesis glycosyltransferase